MQAAKSAFRATGLLCLLLFLSCLWTASAVQARQCIFSLSNRQETSALLGATGVSAYVVAGGENRRGFYIMQVAPTGNWRSIGLQPGDLLISIDRHIITDAEGADNAIKDMGSGRKEIVFVRPDDNGTPQFITVKTDISANVAGYPQAAGFAPADSTRAFHGNQTQRESIPTLESYMAELVNADREHAGQASIGTNDVLAQMARDYAQYMIDHGTFSHTDLEGRNPQVRAAQHGIRNGTYENLAFRTYGIGDERQMVAAAEAQMMREPPGQQNHRSNILEPKHCCMGIGIARGAGRLMMVQEFTDTPP